MPANSVPALPPHFTRSLLVRLLPFGALLTLIFVERSGFPASAFPLLAWQALKLLAAAAAVAVFWLPPTERITRHAAPHRTDG